MDNRLNHYTGIYQAFGIVVDPEIMFCYDEHLK